MLAALMQVCLARPLSAHPPAHLNPHMHIRFALTTVCVSVEGHCHRLHRPRCRRLTSRCHSARSVAHCSVALTTAGPLTVRSLIAPSLTAWLLSLSVFARRFGFCFLTALASALAARSSLTVTRSLTAQSRTLSRSLLSQSFTCNAGWVAHCILVHSRSLPLWTLRARGI